jgi:hypothetical protein
MEESIKRFTFIRANNYAYWRTQLPGVDLPWAVFGEHFTTDGILEDQIKVGDRIRVGSAEFMVTQPRMPCYKLGIRFNRRDMVNRFLESKRTGFYVAVVREGEVEEGDAIEFTDRQESGVTITDIVPARRGHDHNRSIPSKGAAREKGAPHPNLVPAEERSSLRNPPRPAVHVSYLPVGRDNCGPGPACNTRVGTRDRAQLPLLGIVCR